MNVYKSNAYIQFDKIIYLDRYVDENFEKLKEKRLGVKEWKKEYEELKQQVDKYKKSKVSQE